MKFKTYTTYAISDPRTGLFVYVGQTGNFDKRKQQHLKWQQKKPPYKAKNIINWLFDASAAGIAPEFSVLEVVDTEEKSLISEFAWIRKLRFEKHPLLNNWKLHRSAILIADDEKAMAMAIAAIKIHLEDKKLSVRDYSNSAESHAKKTWLPSENEKLIELYTQGKGGNEIAKLLCRPFRGVCARLVRLGIVPDRASVRE